MIGGNEEQCPQLNWVKPSGQPHCLLCSGQLKCNGSRAETRFCISAKRTSPFKSKGASVHSSTGSRGVRMSGCNAEYTMFRGNVKGTGYPLHWPVSPSLPLPCVTVCHHISTGVYHQCSQPHSTQSSDKIRCVSISAQQGAGSRIRWGEESSIRLHMFPVILWDKCTKSKIIYYVCNMTGDLSSV